MMCLEGLTTGIALGMFGTLSMILKVVIDNGE
jgi:hypothetical protein